MQNRRHAYLLDFLKSAEFIQKYVSGCILELVIGDAAAQLAPETKALSGELPFRRIVGMRNRVVHDHGQHLHLPLVNIELTA